jgi:hypothetical protein
MVSGVSTQARAARIAGAALLVICASAFLSNDLVVPGDAGATARNIVDHERWFRTGIFGELVMLNGDVVLALALFRLLAPVNAALALAGTLWRLANVAMLALGVIMESVAADVVVDDRYVTALGPHPAAALMRTLLHVHGTATSIGLIFFGLGAALHAWLFWTARYIPRLLSGAYITVATGIVISCSLLVIFPGVIAIVDPWVIAPDFLVELAVALWLLIKGVRTGSNNVGDAEKGNVFP